MDYTINPATMTSVFMVPSAVVDSHIKLATEKQLKVLLFLLKNIANGVETTDIAESLKISVSEAEDALYFWADAGVLLAKEQTKLSVNAEKTTKKPVKPQVVKPTREEIAMMGTTDENIAFLLREAEMKFGRGLRGNEMQTLVWLYCDQGMQVSLILMLIEYAVNEKRLNLSFIESTAVAWLDAGVDSILAAEKEIERQNNRKTAWGIVQRTFGIEPRKPSAKELDFSENWILNWGFKDTMLKLAYDICVDAKSKVDMRYINKVLESWNSKEIKTPEDVEKDSKKPTKKTKNNFSAYDKNLVEKLLNKD
ncbi:MAG: DnaD domain protein [Clostridia bacterium]|nr:DnaD domain protein [Clostridia bacterium]